jgi:signal transduction histidine kinase
VESVANTLTALVQAALRSQELSEFLEEAAAAISDWAGEVPVSIEYRSGARRSSATAGPAPRTGATPHSTSWTDKTTDTDFMAQLYCTSQPPAIPTIDTILAVTNALATILDRSHGVERTGVSPRRIVDANPLPTALIDSDGVVLSANSGFVTLTGFGEDLPASSRSLTVLPVFLDNAPFIQALEVAAAGTRWEGSLTVCREEDRRSCDAVLTRIVGFHPDWLLLTLHDRTDQVRLQREAIAREKLATAGEIASGVAHEVNNPLAAIRIEAELLASGTDDAETKDSARVIVREVDRASRIATMLIHLTRRTGRELHNVQLNDLLREVLDLRSRLDPWQYIDLRTELDPALPPVAGQLADLRQVLFSLIVNAEDAVQGVAQPVIEVRTELAGSRVRISISDSGTGVPMDLRQRIFDPFFTTKDPDKGSGLGLSLSSSVVAEMGGKIWVEGSPLGGACFVVELAHDRTQ